MNIQLLADSHRRQFTGEDFETVAVDIASSHGIPWESDDYVTLQSNPEPDCDCGFCETVDWEG